MPSCANLFSHKGTKARLKQEYFIKLVSSNKSYSDWYLLFLQLL